MGDIASEGVGPSASSIFATKIDDLHEAVRRDLNVRGFQVAVDDTLGGCFQCFGDLSRYSQRVVNGNRTAGDGVGERVAFDEFSTMPVRPSDFSSP